MGAVTSSAFIDVDALGRRVRIGFDAKLDVARVARLRQAWSGALAASDGAPDAEVAFTCAEDGASFEWALEQTTIDVTLAALAGVRERALLFHAAGLADERGRVVAFVGASGRGKTTLSRTLGREFGYVSDETVSVDEALRVRPYRKPLSVVRGDEPKEQLSPAAAGLRDLPEAPLTLNALVLIDRDSALEAVELDWLPLEEAIPMLGPQMSYLRERITPLQDIARLVDALGGVRMLRYPDASAVPPVMATLFADREVAAGAPGSSASGAWERVPAAAASGPYDTGDVTDAIRTGGGIVVMAGIQVLVLGEIASEAWASATAGRDDEQIIADVVAVYGTPPDGDAATLVAGTLAELITAGVLRRRA